jgi:DNA ligase (NAD+)
MYSLGKEYEESNIDKSVFSVNTPKLDGNAISILYIEGKLVLALTRGDGIRGHDITDKVSYLVPTEIEETETLQVDGEVVALSSIENSRNFVAGALGLKDNSEWESRIQEGNIKFAAYMARSNDYIFASQYTVMMEKLSVLGFSTVYDDWSDYPKDGVVYRVNDMALFASMGFTNKHPRGAIALKEKLPGVETTLLRIVWQTGRTGKVTPVAILKPVKIEGAVCTKASLHNPAIMLALGVYEGCQVLVHRAGSIIPQIIEVLD